MFDNKTSNYIAVGIFLFIGFIGLVLLMLGIVAGIDYNRWKRFGDVVSLDFLIANLLLCGVGGFLLLVALMGIGVVIYKGLTIW